MNSISWTDSPLIYPTDTVWGIGGNIHNRRVYEEVQKIKRSPLTKPVSIAFSSMDQLKRYFELDKNLPEEMLKVFFTLETTLLIPRYLNRGIQVPDWIHQSETSIGVRLLERPTIIKIIKEVGQPLITTSLNRSGENPLKVEAVAREFQRQYAQNAVFIPAVTQEEQKMSGSSSTIVSYFGPKKFRIARPGQRVEEVKKLLQISP